MTARIPVLHGYADDGATCAWRHGRPIRVDAFVADARALADRLPAAGHVLNIVTDRYRFAVGFVAAALRGQISLLPPSTHTATISQLRARFPDAYCLTEVAQRDIDLPQTLNDRADGRASSGGGAVPALDADRTVAYVFTSGSTGVPTMHRKRWGALVVNVRSEAERLGCTADAGPTAVVATVPAQHMYGFESSLMMPLQSGQAIVAERPFYPADVSAALAALPVRRLLVTTPFHLRTWIDADAMLPSIAAVVCATAPLSSALALRAERATGAPVLEIYGCTETGQLASRRPAVDESWRLLGDVMLHEAAGTTIASGGHVEEPTPLGDVIELEADFATSRRFRLAGRAADLVNIAGKRTSLGHLNVQLNAIDGVIDGVFVAPTADEADDADGHVGRLCAVVVAPTLDAQRLLAALRTRIDPIFLPRPLHFVDRLPRNESGKVTQAALRSLLDDRAFALASRGVRPESAAGSAPDEAGRR